MPLKPSTPWRNIYADDDIVLRPYWWQALLLRAKPGRRRLTHMMRWSIKHYGERHDAARAYAERQYGLKVGKYTYGFKQFCHAHLTLGEIGAFSSIADNVHVAFANHCTDHVSTHSFLDHSKYGFAVRDRTPTEIDPRNVPATIGHDVWIGRDATLLCGIHIGTGSVVAAGSVVTKDVPPYAVVAGVPAKILKYRFDPVTIETLLASAWWLWPDARIKERIGDFYDPQTFAAQPGRF